MGCVYCITNVKTGKRYIGQTVGPSWEFRYGVGLNVNRFSTRLKRSAMHHGRDAFVVGCVATDVSDGCLDCLERIYIGAARSSDPMFGYNLEEGGRSNKRQSPAYLERLSAIRKNSEPLVAHCKKMGAMRRGAKLAPEVRSRLAERNRARSATPEWRAFMSRTMTGRQHGPDWGPYKPIEWEHSSGQRRTASATEMAREFGGRNGSYSKARQHGCRCYGWRAVN